MSTWGQLRLILSTASPDVSLDLIDSYLNTRYTSVLAATDWIGLKAHATLMTAAAYQSVAGVDTVTLTVGSNAVAGAATVWTGAISGQKFYRPGDRALYIASYVSGNSLTLDRPYEGLGTEAPGAVYTASPYVFMQNVYPLPSDCRGIVTVLDPITQLPLNPMTKAGLDASAGSRTFLGDPHAYAEYDDTPEPPPPGWAPPVLHQIEFFPPPLRARGFPLQYLRDPYIFDGTNTERSPLPFLSDLVLLEGARADIARNAKALAQAGDYEASFSRELARLLLVEHTQRRTNAPIHMANRFTRHRLARAGRGQSSTWRGGIPGGAT